MKLGRRTLQELPRFRDGWTFVYVDKTYVERDRNCVVFGHPDGEIAVPSAMIACLMLGPGATITHAAVTLLGDTGATVAWAGADTLRFYAVGRGTTARAANLEAQARAWADPDEHMEVVKRMYRMRFAEELPAAWTIQQIRGREGVRVRDTYARLSAETGIPWKGRSYDRGDWHSADPVNRALSTANAVLHAVCHAAVVTTGFSPGLGFVHAGKMMSFVYDIADLYKMETTVPVAFREVAFGTADLEKRVRRACRAAFFENRIVERIVPDIRRALGLKPEPASLVTLDDPRLWDPDAGTVAGGVDHSSEPH